MALKSLRIGIDVIAGRVTLDVEDDAATLKVSWAPDGARALAAMLAGMADQIDPPGDEPGDDEEGGAS
jgi:hypothetical protein